MIPIAIVGAGGWGTALAIAMTAPAATFDSGP